MNFLFFFSQNIAFSIMGAILIETFPINVRNTATGICGGISTVFSLLGSSFAGIIMENTENNLIFCIVFSFSLLIGGISCMFVIETKNFDSNTFFKINSEN